MKKKNIIIIGIIILVCIGMFLGIYLLNGKKESDAKRFTKEYNQVTENNVFVYRNAKEIIKILEKGTGIVYLGFPECPWCQAYVKILNEVAKEEEVKKIYYFNILEDRKNNTEDYQKIVALLKDKLDVDEEGNERIFVPDVSFVIDGKIIGHDNETSMISGETTPTEYWTNAKITELKEKLRPLIVEVASGICSSCDK